MTSTTRSRRAAKLAAVLLMALGVAMQRDSAGSRGALEAAPDASLQLSHLAGVTPRNVIFVLVDDLRFDAAGFLGHPWLETPHLDGLARRGVHLRNAFVTTALCSPSRASILTGQYAHRHRVVDNNSPVPTGTIYFPQYLQRAGYETAFIGKWHMGADSDAPQPGFDRWVSFRGQGTYQPSQNGLNVDGRPVPQRGYITDELTEYALDWLRQRQADRPFFLYLSHKAVHSEFVPAERHRGRYANRPFAPPPSMADTPENYAGKPMWVRNQRNSWHGVDFAYHGTLDIADYYRRYAETLLAVDESMGRIESLLRERGLLESTIVMFMGDNGFAFGEHGLIDKRTAYEESMRVPLVMAGGGLPSSRSVDAVVANIDIAPTVLEAAGLTPPSMDGRSFLPLARGETPPWRETLLYEYYWERNFPHTPTVHALRGARFKYIRYQGLWDTDELYDLQADRGEMRNLIHDPRHRDVVARMNAALFETLAATEGLYIPLAPDRGSQQALRRRSGARAAEFPESTYAPEK
jgi:N-acetylglucosamine-6-sulfatase